jgi:aryl-alcohol dehydrogenase-like predicted oxidoreductase
MRTETDEAITRLFAKTQEADKKVVDRVAEVANARGIPRAQVALAWLLAKPIITAPIVEPASSASNLRPGRQLVD